MGEMVLCDGDTGAARRCNAPNAAPVLDFAALQFVGKIAVGHAAKLTAAWLYYREMGEGGCADGGGVKVSFTFASDFESDFGSDFKSDFGSDLESNLNSLVSAA